MSYLFPQISCWVLAIGLCIPTKAQTKGEPPHAAALKVVETGSEQLSKTNNRIEASGKKYLLRWERRQRKLLRKLAAKDSVAASQLKEQFALENAALKKSLANSDTQPSLYISSVDTLMTAAKFLTDSASLQGYSKPDSRLTNKAAAEAKNLQRTLMQSEKISGYMRLQQQLLREKFSAAGLSKHLRPLNKTIYYYSAQINEYRSLLKDHKKAGRKALSVLQKTKAFQDFMQRNSQLAEFFRLPGGDDPALATNVAGLQTRLQVNGLIRQQLAPGGAGGTQVFRQNIQEAQSRLQEISNKIKGMVGGNSNDLMPEGFKPNNQKTKRFRDRLEFGMNIQTQRSRGWFPASSNLGLMVGYKLNDKSIIGIGASYKMGLGKSIRHIRITHEGIGLRSYIDVKLKGSFWMSGGYEMNYCSAFNRISQLQSENAWQQSGLIGVSKTLSMQSRFFKKTKLQLLWDFLSYKQYPQTQPVLFRVGYNF